MDSEICTVESGSKIIVTSHSIHNVKIDLFSLSHLDGNSAKTIDVFRNLHSGFCVPYWNLMRVDFTLTKNVAFFDDGIHDAKILCYNWFDSNDGKK